MRLMCGCKIGTNGSVVDDISYYIVNTVCNDHLSIISYFLSSNRSVMNQVFLKMRIFEYDDETVTYDRYFYSQI
jgi:hypothetical protein